MNAGYKIDLKKVQALLEQGYQECLHLTLKAQRSLERLVKERKGFALLEQKEILKNLYRLAPRLYGVMADTLFRLIPLLQPESRDESQIHLYFWPGYHSCLVGKRIFIRRQNWNLGVGISAKPTDKNLRHYCDSSQARLYQYMVKPRNSSNVLPADVHQWLLRERSFRPTDDAKNLRIPINSLTVLGCTRTKMSTNSEEFFESEVLDLGTCGDSENWGKCFADFIKRIAVEIGDDEQFPKAAPPGPNSEWVTVARQKMHSIWLHSVFRNDKPEWLQSFIAELSDRDVTKPVARSIEFAMLDRVVKEWDDGRPKFCSWTNMSLRPSLDPTKVYAYDTADDDSEKDHQLARKTVGSAEFLSSVPLGSTYFSFVRPWVSEIYSTVRNVEVAIWMHNRKLGEREPTFAGPYIAHEIRKLVDSGLYLTKMEVQETSDEAVRKREFLLYSIGALTRLAYAFTNAVLSMNKQALQKEREKFLAPLVKLRNEGRLEQSLSMVAMEIYESVRLAEGGQVLFPTWLAERWDSKTLDVPQQSSCFLLTVEMISNYCQNEESTSSAEWQTFLDDNTLVIRLDGPTNAQRNPTSTSFARLDLFLHALGIGEANVFWRKFEKRCSYTVKVNLSA